MTGELAEKVTGLVFNCTAVGLTLAGLSAAAAASATLGVGAVAGGLMLRNHLKDPDRLGKAKIGRIRKAAIRAYEFDQSRSPAEREALDKCLKPFETALETAKITPQDLAGVIRDNHDKDFPVCATDYVVGRLAEADARFRSGIEHEFVTHVISECFTAAIEDRNYYAKLDPHIQIEQLKALGRIEDKVDIVIDELRQRNIAPKTERRAIRMLGTIDTDDMTVDQIFGEILIRLEAAERIDEQAHQRSNSGDGFDRLAQSVADALEADVEGRAAFNEIEAALAAQAAETDKMLGLGINTAIAAGQPDKAAAYELQRLASLSPSERLEKANQKAHDYYVEGKRQGIRLSLQIAVSIWTLLQVEFSRKSVPMDWAMTQNNLALALTTLGKRGDDAALARAVTAYEAALDVQTREAAPMQWAMTQNNLANALLTLGERGDDAALARAVMAYKAALEVYTREAAPMDWAMTRENMGDLYLFRALEGHDEIHLAIEAYRDALTVFSADHHPYNYDKASRSLAQAIALRDGPSETQ